MKTRSLIFLVAATVICSLGCQKKEEPIKPADQTTPVPNVNPDEPQVITNAVYVAQEDDEEKKSLFGKARALYDKSKKAADMSNQAQRWLTDKINDSGVKESTEDTMEWANKMYKSLKDQGLTTANNANEWLSEDLKNMNSWEYKVVRIKFSDPSATIEKNLNRLGDEGWECFHISDQSNNQTMFLKRHKSSYLKQLPFRDVLKLLPLLSQGEEPK